MVVVDMFSKMAYFIPRLLLFQLQIYTSKEIVCVHKIPKSITSDQDVKFLSQFLEDFVKKYENKVSIQEGASCKSFRWKRWGNESKKTARETQFEFILLQNKK